MPSTDEAGRRREPVMQGEERINAQENFATIRERLREYYRSFEIDIWLRSAHPQLNGERPCDVINAGRGDEVLAILDRLDDGVYL